jgi:hypothetical protein
MAVNWLEVALKMAEDARARLALNRKRLKEILAERANLQLTVQTETDRTLQPETAKSRPCFALQHPGRERGRSRRSLRLQSTVNSFAMD